MSNVKCNKSLCEINLHFCELKFRVEIVNKQSCMRNNVLKGK